MTKNKTWEEEFDEKFIELAPDGSNWGVGLRTKDLDMYELKDFIADLVEKTRREAIKECNDKTMTIESRILTDGFKAGLQRALELICTSNDLANSKYAQNEEFPDWTVSCKITRENIKEELEK